MLNRMICACIMGLLLFGFRSSIYSQKIYAGRFKAVFNAPPKQVPTGKTPDAPLTGNGDIGLTLGGTPDHLTFYLGKNDFWRAYPVYPGGGIAFPGALTVSIEDLKNAAYHAEQVMDSAFIRGKFKKGNYMVTLKSWVAATDNTVYVTFLSNKPTKVKLQLWSPTGNTSFNDSGKTADIQWVTRSFENTPLLEWPCHVSIAMKTIGAQPDKNNFIMLQPGKSVTVALAVYTNFDDTNWKTKAITAAHSLNSSKMESAWKSHLSWWKNFWSRSTIRMGDPFLEKYYFASQYLLAAATRGDKFAPGIWGPFITKDSSSWGGDYHLNYNYQAPYWAAYSSNHIPLTENFDQPLLDYMPKGMQHAKELLQVDGIYYPVGIGPKGLVTTRWPLTPEEMEKRYGTLENTIDSGYKFLGQKINAVFSVGNMYMRFYSTYDSTYAARIFPYLLACADFWEDYLKFEEGRYVIYMDHFNEVMPRLNQSGNWRERLGDFNSTLSLGLVKMLFKGLIDVSTFLDKEVHRQEKWKHIVEHLSDFPLGDHNGRLSLKSMERHESRTVIPAGLNRVSIHGLLMPAGVAGPKTDSVFNHILKNDVANWYKRKRAKGEWGNTLGNGIETCFPGAVRVGFPADSILKELKERIEVQSLPNLWITQAGGGIETLAAVPLTINEMLLQSYEGVVRVFPNWNRRRDARYENLRAYGAFVVSSSLKNGRVEYVRLLSEKGRPCVMENPWMGSRVQLYRNGKKGELLTGEEFRFTTVATEMIELKEAVSY